MVNVWFRSIKLIIYNILWIAFTAIIDTKICNMENIREREGEKKSFLKTRNGCVLCIIHFPDIVGFDCAVAVVS